MAGAGYKLFSTGDVLSASDVNTYLQQQTVMVFASAAARTTALASVLAEGMVTYLKDTDVVEIYTGAAWVSLDDPNAIQNSIVDAKGDIITATADNTPARLAVGSNGQVLKANSATATGLEWAADSTGMTNPLTTTGDTIYSSSGSTPARLGIGTTGQVLTVASGIPSWATPAAGGGGKVLQVVSTVYSTQTTIASTTMTDSGITLSITPTLSSSKILVLMSVNSEISRSNQNAGGAAQLLRGSTTIISWTGGDIGWQFISTAGANAYLRGNYSVVYLDSPATTSSTTYKLQGRSEVTSNSGQIVFQNSGSSSTITLMEIGA